MAGLLGLWAVALAGSFGVATLADQGTPTTSGDTIPKFFPKLEGFAEQKLWDSPLGAWKLPSLQIPWARRVLPGIYTGGRPDRTQIGLLADAGFASLLSTVPFPANSSFHNMIGDFVATADYAGMGHDLGLVTRVMDSEGVDTLSPGFFKVFMSIVSSLPKPMFIHCYVGFGATVLAMMYAIVTGGVPADEFYDRALSHGFDFQVNPKINTLLASITDGIAAPTTTPAINLRLASGYTFYYHTRRVNDDWYVSGQPNISTELRSMVDSGYGALVNFRADGELDHYWPGGRYNETAEAEAVQKIGLRYFHFAITELNAQVLLRARNTLQAAALTGHFAGPVLVHCGSGYRAVLAVLAHIGLEKRLGVGWAMRLADSMDFSFWASAKADHVVEELGKVLHGYGQVEQVQADQTTELGRQSIFL